VVGKKEGATDLRPSWNLKKDKFMKQHFIQKRNERKEKCHRGGGGGE